LLAPPGTLPHLGSFLAHARKFPEQLPFSEKEFYS
jgi:hypothetical protein